MIDAVVSPQWLVAGGTALLQAPTGGLVVSAVAGIVFGLVLAAPPGPMNAIIAEESVLRGWGAGFRAGLGAAAADGAFFLLAAVGVVGFVGQLPTIRGVMVGVGGGLMLYFAYGAAAEAGLFARLRGHDPETSFLTADADTDRPEQSGEDSGIGAIAGTGFRKAFVLALTNPYQILFWLTVGVGLLDPGRIDVFREAGIGVLSGTLVVTTGSPALLIGFFAGIGVWITGFPAALVSARRRVNRLAPVVAGLSAVALAGFGVAFLVDAASLLM